MPRRRHEQDGQSVAEAFSGLRADYDAARQTRFRRNRSGVSGTGRSADWHYRTEADYLRMLELARDFDRNDVVVGQAVTRLVDNVLMTGMQLDPDTGDRDVDRLILKKRWQPWANDRSLCHASRKLSFHEIERLALRHVIVDGDNFLLPLTAGSREGSLETVEGHRCRTPSNTSKNVVHGVELDRWGGPLRYWFTRQNLDPNTALRRVKDTRQFPAFGQDGQPAVLHIYNPRRFSQTRGVTHLAPVADTAGMHNDLQFAQLVKAQVASVFAIIHEREESFGGPDPGQKGEQSTEDLGDGSTRTIEGMAPGMEIFGAPGSKLEGFAPRIPNPEFFEHAHLLLTFLAINLHLPVAVLLLDPSNTNFSGWRGAIDQARNSFREIQRWLVERLHGPVYRWKLAEWIETDEDLAAAAGRLGDAIFNHKWDPPSWPYLEPMKDASADLLQQRNGLNSPRRIQAARGRQWETVAEEIVTDNAFAIRKAKEIADIINRDFPSDPVHWRELISLPTPDGVNVAVAAAEDNGRSNGGSSGTGRNSRDTGQSRLSRNGQPHA